MRSSRAIVFDHDTERRRAEPVGGGPRLDADHRDPTPASATTH